MRVTDSQTEFFYRFHFFFCIKTVSSLLHSGRWVRTCLFPFEMIYRWYMAGAAYAHDMAQMIFFVVLLYVLCVVVVHTFPLSSLSICFWWCLIKTQKNNHNLETRRWNWLRVVLVSFILCSHCTSNTESEVIRNNSAITTIHPAIHIIEYLGHEQSLCICRSEVSLINSSMRSCHDQIIWIVDVLNICTICSCIPNNSIRNMIKKTILMF